MRKASEIDSAIRKLLDKCWYGRTQIQLHQIQFHREEVPPEAEFDSLVARCKELEAQHGVDALPQDDFGLGLELGRLAALRWILGSDWNDDGALDM